MSIDRESKPLLDFLADYDEKFSTLNRLLGEKDVLSLTYEDDVQPGPEIGYGKVCGYLNIAHLEAGTNFVRTNPYPLRELLVNYEDVRVLLRGTEYEWMLDG